jgi:membrane associated rhomboid family serine protease
VPPAVTQPPSFAHSWAKKKEGRELTWAGVLIFISLLLLVYVTDQAWRIWGEGPSLGELWGLDGRTFFRGRWWAPVSYVFFHSGALHLFLNVGALALFGHALSETWSWRRLALLSLFSSLGGGALWLAIHHGQRGSVIGASAIVCGYVTAFVLERPSWRVPLLGTRWSFPCWVILALLIGIESRGLWTEMRSRLMSGALSHSAHIGGVAVAVTVCLCRRHKRPPGRPCHSGRGTKVSEIAS